MSTWKENHRRPECVKYKSHFRTIIIFQTYTAQINEALVAKNHRLVSQEVRTKAGEVDVFQEGRCYSQNHPGSKRGRMGIAEGLTPCAKFLEHIR